MIQLVSATKAAQMLGVTRQRMYQLVASGKLRPYSEDAPLMFYVADILRRKDERESVGR